MPTILIALGANLGDLGETLTQAVDQIASDPDFTLEARSELLVTKPVGGPSGQPDYLNSAAKFATSLSPDEVHQKLIEVEQSHGRVRIQRWGARKLDLDLLLYDRQTIKTPQLTIPHPRMSFRRFVMQPAAEVAGEMLHPELDTTIGELWQHLCTAPPIIEIAALPGPAVSQLLAAVEMELSDPKYSFANELLLYSRSKNDLVTSLTELTSQQATHRSLPPGCTAGVVPWWFGIAEVLGGTTANTLLATPPARLTVYWNRPEETYGPVEAGWWTPEERNGLQARLAEAVRRRVHAPRLWLEGNDVASAVTELTAAIQAMQG
ncbi:2-amino-4-hydroxy-6-hydroxymethyldihydropteridine diphosphokinase [Blastopirellula marina]|uniref:2-amino-4-hydroxy-6-hydroxymethyldihydropteridine pyrophosphokinase n=1 Tax=Blastopirellula marina TaxID=124 RepID=A0A2S8FEL0_9BACT|nr:MULTISPECIES: 2-amino-4-hydroxy-6-hydroxymethyldihydropteridine diphosphokinase [Pirellulaceae]PQO30613.1 2-amino-4-hydroxy-6-hydroxymethyldihydropteridine diphosphokinase [Blastopirellula marina]RCS50750.1 2-amino-4-hydroxy-6-hydroxymethyldihydropteridine diphosphokinase [Bremerella cremea]